MLKGKVYATATPKVADACREIEQAKATKNTD
jgi:hypothetical protein